MFDDGKIRVLRGVFSWLLDGAGVFVMFACAGLVLLGPRYLHVVLALSSAFMMGYFVRRAGVSLAR